MGSKYFGIKFQRITENKTQHFIEYCMKNGRIL